MKYKLFLSYMIIFPVRGVFLK
uniref:Uncharacterized protein n=1 Tax=Anguilla anguilla TaxID=7936 RepID=A0A0E9RVA6_ANGAN